MNFLKLLLNLSLSIFICSHVSLVHSNDRDVAVLLQVKNHHLTDPNNRLTGWSHTLTPISPCNWTGIACDPQNNYSVVAISLDGFNVSGRFPSGFCRIQTLRNLSLGDNSFFGQIDPLSLSFCSQLYSLNLSFNYFVGEIPEFEPVFSSLVTLDFSGNNFSGKIPESFGTFPVLEILRLSGNFLNGTVPEFLTNLTELTHLELAYNPFEPGPIPSSIGKLKKLENLWISYGNLIGKIPKSIGGLISIKTLDLSRNNLTGEVPETIGRLKKIERLELYENQLSGELLETISNMASLNELDLSENKLSGKLSSGIARMHLYILNLNDNRFEGKVPESLALNPNLVQLKLFNNKFSGELPVDLGLNSDIVDFDVSGNEFEGPLPPNLCSRNKLEHLVAFDNRFSGNIPETYGNCTSLNYIRLYDNKLSGTVPVQLWSFSGLEFVQLGNNKFEGSIPKSISKNLIQLLISDNKFSGEIPKEICQVKNLAVLDLSKNQFSGKLPMCMTKLIKLQKLELQENEFEGELVKEVGSWKELTELNLSNNKLTGRIPGDLGKLPVLTYLDLEGNSLSGEIPEELTKLKLNKFNISNNKLEGKVPVGFNNPYFLQSLLNNPNLCSPNLKPLPSCARATKHIKSTGLYVIAILASLALLLIVTFIWIIKSKLLEIIFKNKHRPWKITSFQRVDFDEEDLLASMTKENLIGSGGSGQVYKVNLKNRQIVAVKRLWESKKQVEEFQSEVKILGKIRHVNIVKLLLSCFEEDFRILVYEYMENGSLGDLLHNNNKRAELLDWPTRFSIAIGAAQGLCYLHHDCVPPIIHRDIKSNNILLDEDFRPRVADFGLAKSLHLDTEKGDVAMSRVAGSYGYIAPEYGYTVKVNERSDVFSFGIVLLELITGKRPTDDSFGEYKDIVKWVTETAISSSPQAKISEANINYTDLGLLIDPRMNPSNINEEEVKKVLNVALLCTSAFPMNRPSMRRVVELLLKNHKLAPQK